MRSEFLQHFHLDAVANAFDKFDGESGKTVANLERNPGFGRSISVTDDGLRKGLVQAVEDRLVSDFAGQPDIARRNIADRRRHQRTAPMRRRSQQMGDAVAGEAFEMIADRLAGAGQNKRNAAEHRAQENLQAAIAADVVERTPDRIVADRPATKRRGQAGERMHHHFRHAGGARREHHPIGLA